MRNHQKNNTSEDITDLHFTKYHVDRLYGDLRLKNMLGVGQEFEKEVINPTSHSRIRLMNATDQ
jgi:hypothetical protein